MADSYTRCEDSVPEGSSCEILANFVDEDGVAIDALQIEELQLSLWAMIPSRPVIQGILNEDSLNANMGTLTAAGDFTITILGAANVIMDPPSEHETHRIMVKWTYAGGNRIGKALIDFDVFRVDWAAP